MDEVEGTTPLKDALFEGLAKPLAGYDFRRAPRRDLFVRAGGGVTDFFYVICFDAGRGYRIQPGAGVRIENVEDLFHKTSGFSRRDAAFTNTMGCPIGVLMGGTARTCAVRLESTAGLASAVIQIMEAFRELRYRTLNAGVRFRQLTTS